MTSTIEQQPPVSQVAPTASKWKTWLPIALFCVLWADLIRLLSTQWEAREQYAYGWFVPFFAAALLWRRWLDKPNPESRKQKAEMTGASNVQPSTFNLQPSAGEVAPHPQFLLSTFCFLLLFLLLPLRVIYEINSDWPLISWTYTLIVVFLTLYAFHLAAPQSTINPQPSAVSGSELQPSAFSLQPFSWLRHFAFPVSFILIAVVWPYRIEKGLTQDLMQVVARLTVELLGWLDIPAIQRGNLIELATGTVGIDEACSGIRSFQSCLMAGLLMGELYRLRLRPRLALVAIGIALGFCFNIVRTLLLSYQANQQGLGALEKWHDPAGITITIACFFALWALALLVQKAESRKQATQKAESGKQKAESRPGSNVSLLQPLAFSLQPSLRRYLLAVGLWSILCIAATEAWYRSHTPKDSGVFHWSVVLPEGKAGFEKIQLAPRTIKLLKYDLAATGKWRVEDGSEWNVNFFRWQPRSIESVITSRVHRPEVCLPASGFRQLSDSELIQVEANGLKLPFRKYTYELDGRKLYVFFCQWEDGAENQAGMQSSGQADRLQSVLKGRRLVGQQTLEIIISDCGSLDQAEQQVRKQLPSLIRLELPASKTQAAAK